MQLIPKSCNLPQTHTNLRYWRLFLQQTKKFVVMEIQERRYDLDWLRVLVFGLLILYHAGMFFVPWGWHIKNNETYTWLIWPMRFINQWRLPILFVISGMGTWYALNRRTGLQFTRERLKKLLLPLAVGIVFIVPPQVYLERIAHDQFQGGFFDFWPHNAFTGIYPSGNFSWHHLWFLPYLLVYSLLLAPLFVYLKAHPGSRFFAWMKRRLSRPAGLYIFILPLYITYALIRPFHPVTHNLVNDWFTFSNYLVLFFSGFVLVSIKDTFWPLVQTYRHKLLMIAVISYTIYNLMYYLTEDTVGMHFLRTLFQVINLWSWILVLFGYASEHLNRKSSLLSYCNQAVYPFYILHQTITVFLAYLLMHKPWGFALKFFILLTGTLAICWLLYELLIRRISWLGPLFGMKWYKREKKSVEVTPCYLDK